MNEQLTSLLMGLGAVAEVAKAFYDSLERQGFRPEQALELTKVLVADLLKGEKK